MKTKTIELQVMEAIDSGSLDVISRLIKENPEHLHYKTPFAGQTWLGYAARLAPVESVRHLVSLGFAVDEGNVHDDVKPLCHAGYKDRPDVARYLLDAGAVMDTATSVQNPLFAAIVGKSAAVAQLLLERGIDAGVRYNSKTMKNMDAVAFARMQGELECARIIALWNAGGDEAVAEKLLEAAAKIAKDNAYRKKQK